MPRGPRRDHPGAWHHVMDRGLARRTVFETPADRDLFLALLAEEVAAGRIEVHVYCLMTTHFHILVRSPVGQVSEALRRVLNAYVRAFNRGRRRDGALFRGRFQARLITSAAHWVAVLWYIDRNPVAAGLVARSTDWPHGSAWWYARPSGPAWLRRDLVERVSCADGVYDPRAYPSRTGGDDLAWVDDVVERRLRSRGGVGDPFDDLLRAGPAEVQAWMARKTRLADGTAPGFVVASAGAILSAVDPGPGGAGQDDRDPAVASRTVALLRLAGGLTFQEVAAKTGRSITWVRARLAEHDRRMASDPGYARAAADALARVLRMEAGRLGDPRVIPIVSPAAGPSGLRSTPGSSLTA